MSFAVLAAMATAGFVWAVLARQLCHVFVTGPMFMAGAGLLIHLVSRGEVSHELKDFTHLLAELTLVVVLFSDASRINLRHLGRHQKMPRRLLLMAMPLVIVTSTITALFLFPGLGFAGALALAAILAPTDAALGEATVLNPDVPEATRIALSVESGLNDGIALIVVLFSFCLLGWEHPIDTSVGWIQFGLTQVVFGVAFGVMLGYAGARILRAALHRGWLDPSLQGVAGLSVAALAWAAAETAGGNGFIASFFAGLAFGSHTSDETSEAFEFLESEGQLLVLGTFLLFGFVLLPEALENITFSAFAYAMLSLTVLRMLPVFVSTSRTGPSVWTRLFIGWFGPRGLASVLFALLAVELVGPANSAIVDQLVTVVYLTVGLSIVLHGVSATPLAGLYARHMRSERIESKGRFK